MNRKHVKVLLIEDNPGDTRLIREMLANGAGLIFACECVTSLSAGLQHIAHGDIDVVLLDLGLPDSVGLNTLRHLHAGTPRVPAVVVMSGLDDEEIAVQAVQEGAQDYLVKGQVDSSLLIRSLRYAIERAEAEAALQQARAELEKQVVERTTTLANTIESLQREIAQRQQAEEALHRLNRELRAISNCNQVLMRAVDEQTLLNDICRIICDEAGYRLAWVGYVEHDEAKTVRPAAWGGLDGEYVANAKLSWADDAERAQGPGGTAIRSGEIVYIQDFITDPRMTPWREGALQRGYRSVIGLPLKDENANVFGALLIYSTEINAFTPDELRLLNELAGDLAFGIGVLRVRTERKRVEETLRESETRFRAVFENSVDAIGVSKAGIHIFINPAYLALFGYAENAELIGKPILDLIAPSRHEQILENVHRRASGQTAPTIYETRGLRKDGSEFDMDVHMSTYELNGEIYSVPIIRDITERKRAETEIQALAKFPAENPNPILRITKEGLLLYANRASADLIECWNCSVGEQLPEFWHRLILETLDSGLPREEETVCGARVFALMLAPFVESGYVNLYGRDITERKRMEDASFFVAQRGWQAGTENFLDALAQFLGENLNVDYVIIDRIAENPAVAETVALYAKGAMAPNMRYALKGTPCENVMGRRLCVYPQGVQQLFPEDTLLAEMGVESYVGIPLWDSTGRAIGLIALMSSKQLPDVASATQLLQLIATRAAAELEREQSDRLLRTREHEFRTLAENSPDVIVRYDREGRRIYVNPEFERVNRLSAQEVYGKRPVELSTELAPMADVFTEKLIAAMASGAVARIDLSWIKDGKPICWFVRIVPEFDADGKVASALTIWSDISERKQTEEALRHSEERFRRLAENAQDVIYKMSLPDGKYEYVSPAALAVFGYSPEECYKRPRLIQQTIHPDWQAYFQEQWVNLIEGNMPPTYEYQIIHKSGQVRWLNQRNILVRDDAGTPIAIEGIVTDVTERKRAEEEIARALQAEKKAREVAEILREANESLSRTLNLDDVLQNLLQYLSRLVPYDSANVMLLEGGFQLRVVALHSYERWVDPDMTRKIAFDIRTAPILNELVATQKSALIADTREHPGWIRPAGAEHVISWLGVPIVADRQVIGLYSVDKVEPGFFTEEHRRLAEGLAGQAAVAIQNTRLHNQIKHANAELEQRVADRTAQLEAANKELEAFAYSVSHDLRAPLRHIDGFLELLQQRSASTLDEQSRHYMQTIASSARRMGLLIDDLLSFSRMGRHELSRQSVDLNGLVQEVTRDFEPETHGRDIHWRIADLPVVTGDRALLRMVLVNLLSNALKFTQPRPHSEIEVGFTREAKEIVLFVRDNGVGFDMQYVDKLFSVFQRLHPADEFEGTGIGLANVRRIINRHGGRTWAEGKVDHGATFFFTLPK